MGRPALLFVYRKVVRPTRPRRRKGMNLFVANSNKKNTVDTVWQLAEPIAAELGLTLWDVRFVKEGATWILRVLIDRPDGVSIDDCEAMSRALDEPLDAADPIDCAYCLEVSSPGIERELTRPAHFAQMQGRSVRLHRIRPDSQNRREVQGTLRGLNGDEVCVTCADGTECAVPRKELASVTLADMDWNMQDEATED